MAQFSSRIETQKVRGRLLCVSVCVCVCVRKSEREIERKRAREQWVACLGVKRAKKWEVGDEAKTDRKRRWWMTTNVPLCRLTTDTHTHTYKESNFRWAVKKRGWAIKGGEALWGILMLLSATHTHTRGLQKHQRRGGSSGRVLEVEERKHMMNGTEEKQEETRWWLQRK